MRKTSFFHSGKVAALSLLILALFIPISGQGRSVAYARAASSQDACGQLLAEAEARFLGTLAPDGSVPVSPETEAAAAEYIRVSKLCFEEMESQTAADSPLDSQPTFIDEGGVLLEGKSSSEFVAEGRKWGGASGNTVTYSFMGDGKSLSREGTGTSVALSSLPGFQACFITEIQNAFAAWQAAANIRFVQVNDSGSAFDAADASGDIRIGAHAFDGAAGVLAHAYYPPPNGVSAAGDVHFDRAESWTCNNQGVDIGVVALHEIGHALGLAHEGTPVVAVMDPFYNSSLLELQTDDIHGAVAIYGMNQLAAPSNDDFDGATTINPIPFTSSINVTDATRHSDDPHPINPCSSPSENRSLKGGHQTVWYKYTPTVTQPISLDTIGSTYDTYLSVWTGTRNNLTLVKCNDDTYENIQSELFFTANLGTTYYVQVGSFRGYEGGPPTAPSLNAKLEFHAYVPNTNVRIGNNLIGRYFIPDSASMRRIYSEVNNGPVKVINTKGDMTLASQRVIYLNQSYSEMMGLPQEQLTTEYWFPYYNNTAMSSQLRVGNMGNVPTTIRVYLAGSQIDSFTLGAGLAERRSYAGQNNGPLRVTSSAADILTTVRVLYGNISYSEMMGLPVEQLSREYLFPYYNNVAMSSQLRVSNLGGVPTTITVSLAGGQIDSFTLGAGQAERKTYTGQNSGPLRVSSTAADVLTSIRVLYADKSYSEIMGLPVEQLGQEYWYPIYDDVNVDSQLRIGNVGDGPTTITVYLAGSQIDSYTLQAGQATRETYSIDNGPLRVVSSAEPILSTVRLLYQSSTFSSLYEMMGLPDTQLSTQYFFPWYNNEAMNSQLRFAIP